MNSSVTNQSRHRNKKIRGKIKRREVRRDSLSTLRWTDSTFQAEECFPYKSQSEAGVEDMFLLVSASQRQIYDLEGRVADFLSLSFVSSANIREDVSDGIYLQIRLFRNSFMFNYFTRHKMKSSLQT